MSDLDKLLDDLGLGFYAHAFAQNDIDIKTLPLLTEADLKAMGLPLGSRRKLQSEIARLTRAQCAAGAQRQNDAAAVRDPHRPPERRQLTVMFCDLVGSTAMSARLDPEDLTDVMNGYRDACKKSIDRFGGFVARFVGDGILAYFGYPSAHEDDAERALRCGLS
ncbi:MAG: adenylate/guanylate cyclase domain-containing protein, partial [Alphaproteobacteria bacterium]